MSLLTNYMSQLADAPLLVGLLANEDPAAIQYAEWTGKACRNDGLRYELRKVDRMDVERALQVGIACYCTKRSSSG